MAKVLVLFVWSFFSDAFPQAIPIRFDSYLSSKPDG